MAEPLGLLGMLEDPNKRSMLMRLGAGLLQERQPEMARMLALGGMGMQAHDLWQQHQGRQRMGPNSTPNMPQPGGGPVMQPQGPVGGPMPMPIPNVPPHQGGPLPMPIPNAPPNMLPPPNMPMPMLRPQMQGGMGYPGMPRRY